MNFYRNLPRHSGFCLLKHIKLIFKAFCRRQNVKRSPYATAHFINDSIPLFTYKYMILLHFDKLIWLFPKSSEE